MSDDHTNLTEEDEIYVDAIGLPAMPETGNGTYSDHMMTRNSETFSESQCVGVTNDNLLNDPNNESVLGTQSQILETLREDSCLSSFSNSQTQLRELKNWAFNNLLFKISENTSNEDFENMRLFFEDELGNAKEVEKITSTTLLLSSLKRRDLLGPDNLIYLQGALYNVRNMELVRLCAEYARDKEDIFHLYRLPEVGNLGSQDTLIEVHVKGYNRLSRQELDTIKFMISRLIFLPIEHIRLVGIKPSSSFILVFLLPKEYASYLKDLLEEDRTQFIHISYFGIDSINVDNVTYRINDHVFKETETCQDCQKSIHSLPVSTSQFSETSTFEHQQMMTENAERLKK